MTTKKIITKKSKPNGPSYRAITSKPLRIEKRPGLLPRDIAQTKVLQDLREQAQSRMYLRAITDLVTMLLATTEAIEHYADGERKNDPIVRAHAEIAKKSRALINKLAKAKTA
jgi:hypothetical protein